MMTGSTSVPAKAWAFCAEALPSDESSRAFHLVRTSHAVLAMTDPDPAAQPFVEGPDRLERQCSRWTSASSCSDSDMLTSFRPHRQPAEW
ncbi:TetR family transcriptional regulator [Streptomyces hygroscopicus]|nr:TetR family transcriptional regulator [Streptomyces hygroscopicus]